MAAKLVITNSDPGARSFPVEALGTHVTINPGSETVVELRDLPAGPYTFIAGSLGTRSS